MQPTEPVDIYCERLAHGMWEEPLNLITNVAFFIAAYFAAQHVRERYRPAHPRRLIANLCGLMVLVGIGSSLFHSFANQWSQLADVIPIGMYILYFLFIFFRHVVGLEVRGTIIGLVAYMIGSSMLASTFRVEVLNGSEGYFGPLFTLYGISVWEYRRKSPNIRPILIAALLFTWSLVMRSIDDMICPIFPIGTHWLWHCSNGAVLYFVTTYAAAASCQPDRRQPSSGEKKGPGLKRKTKSHNKKNSGGPGKLAHSKRPHLKVLRGGRRQSSHGPDDQ